jgi:SAM-dependent methyltransferase
MGNPAEGYEGYMVPVLFAPWAADLVEAADPRPGHRVLDVGCGTGIVARQVARRLGAAGAVTGLDLSPHMLAVARAAAGREGVSIDWREGRAESLPFPDRSFDRVLSQFALMFITDKAAALAAMRRVVKPDGRVVVHVWQGLDRHPFYRTLNEVIQSLSGVSALQEIFSLADPEALHSLATGAGFRRVEIVSSSKTAHFPNPEAFLAGEIEVDTAAIPAMQGLDEKGRKEIVDAISSRMQAPLQEVTRGDQVVIPFHAHRMVAWPQE